MSLKLSTRNRIAQTAWSFAVLGAFYAGRFLAHPGWAEALCAAGMGFSVIRTALALYRETNQDDAELREILREVSRRRGEDEGEYDR